MLTASKPGSMGKIGRRLATEGHVRPTLIVVFATGPAHRSCSLQYFKPVRVQALVAKRSIETSHLAVIGWQYKDNKSQIRNDLLN